MTDTEALNPLRRMLRPADPPKSGPTDMDVLSRAMRRAADFVVGMPVQLKGGEASEVSLVELAAQLNEQDLTMMLIGRDGARAIMTCDGPMVSALIEMSTIGHVTTANSVARRMTRTDVALITPFLGQVLVEVSGGDADVPVTSLMLGYDEMTRVLDVSTVELIMPQVQYHVYDLSLELGQGSKTGRVMLCLPKRASQNEKVAQDTAKNWKASVEATVLDLPSQLDAVLHTVSMPLSEVRAFVVGDMIKMAASSLKTVQVRGLDSQTITTARLGQVHGTRALCLNGGQVSGTQPFTPAQTNELALPEDILEEIQALASDVEIKAENPLESD